MKEIRETQFSNQRTISLIFLPENTVPRSMVCQFHARDIHGTGTRVPRQMNPGT